MELCKPDFFCSRLSGLGRCGGRAPARERSWGGGLIVALCGGVRLATPAGCHRGISRKSANGWGLGDSGRCVRRRRRARRVCARRARARCARARAACALAARGALRARRLAAPCMHERLRARAHARRVVAAGASCADGALARSRARRAHARAACARVARRGGGARARRASMRGALRAALGALVATSPCVPGARRGAHAEGPGAFDIKRASRLRPKLCRSLWRGLGHGLLYSEGVCRCTWSGPGRLALSL